MRINREEEPLSQVSFDHEDPLSRLNEKSTMADKVAYIRQVISRRYDFVDRIAIAVYDAQLDLLGTYVHSSDCGNPLEQYQAKLSDTPSLLRIVQEKKPRIVNDLNIFHGSTQKHTQRILAHGYKSSYTLPIFRDEALLGFVFFNSRKSDVFDDENLNYLDMIGRLLSMIVNAELGKRDTLLGALKTATFFAHHRDPETGSHLSRMSRFARMIACDVAPKYGLDDESIEHLYWFSPLHDIGKIGIADSILLKPGKLTPDEFNIMKRHTRIGGEIVQVMFDSFKFSSMEYLTMLGNIVAYHHENVDGSGYPEGLAGEEIPIEARIVAVADVFDALTSERPYKKAWSNARAFATLNELAGKKLAPDLVTALIARREEIEEIQARFRDDKHEHSCSLLDMAGYGIDTGIHKAVEAGKAYAALEH